jgi:hypothetical protein
MFLRLAVHAEGLLSGLKPWRDDGRQRYHADHNRMPGAEKGKFYNMSALVNTRRLFVMKHRSHVSTLAKAGTMERVVNLLRIEAARGTLPLLHLCP